MFYLSPRESCLLFSTELCKRIDNNTQLHATAHVNSSDGSILVYCLEAVTLLTLHHLLNDIKRETALHDSTVYSISMMSRSMIVEIYTLANVSDDNE